MAKKKSKQIKQQKQIVKYQQFKSKQKVIAQQYKTKMRPFVNFLRKHNLKFTHASIGQTRVQYFRLDQFQKLIQQKQSQLKKNQQLVKLYNSIKSQLIYYKRPQHIKIKYPNKLQPVDISNSDKKYASFRFDTTQSKKWLIITLISIVFMLVLLPIWPYELKYALWWISFILLIFLTSLIIIRLVVYLLCSIVGYNVWILPNLLGDYGIWGSITPFVYYQKWENNLFNILVRIFLFSSLIALICFFYLNPNTFYQNIQSTKQVVNDIHDWGVMKIKNQKNFSQRAITNLQVILNQTAQVQQMYLNQNTQNNYQINQDENQHIQINQEQQEIYDNQNNL